MYSAYKAISVHILTHINHISLLHDEQINQEKLTENICMMWDIIDSPEKKWRFNTILVASCRTAVTPLLMHWSYCSLPQSPIYNVPHNWYNKYIWGSTRSGTPKPPNSIRRYGEKPVWHWTLNLKEYCFLTNWIVWNTWHWQMHIYWH